MNACILAISPTTFFSCHLWNLAVIKHPGKTSVWSTWDNMTTSWLQEERIHCFTSPTRGPKMGEMLFLQMKSSCCWKSNKSQGTKIPENIKVSNGFLTWISSLKLFGNFYKYLHGYSFLQILCKIQDTKWLELLQCFAYENTFLQNPSVLEMSILKLSRKSLLNLLFHSSVVRKEHLNFLQGLEKKDASFWFRVFWDPDNEFLRDGQIKFIWDVEQGTQTLSSPYTCLPGRTQP